MITLKVKLGKTMIEYQGQDFKTVCDFSTLLGMMPEKCGKCGRENIYLYHKAPKGNDYYGVACKDCGAEFNFHQKKEGGFYIRHDDVWQKFGEDNAGQGGGQQPRGGQETEEFDDDVPF